MSDREMQESIRWMRHTASARGIRDMLEVAKSDLAVTPESFDKHDWLLNCPNGTLELCTGNLREHRHADHLTKLCPTRYEPNAVCPTWLAFLDTILAGDSDLISYLQRLMGYWLTGDVREQILPILWGTGSNGKSTLVNVVMDMMGGDYAIMADKSLVVAKEREGHSTERMDLFGRRLAVVQETDEGQKFAEAAVKQLTGGDVIRGRRMREDTWEYRPTHKILLVTNHKPRVRATDHAFWRRVKLIHFGVTIPDDMQDKKLPAKLRAEHAGILAWAVRGCLDWQSQGLGEPEAVRLATANYRAVEDVIGQFVADCCIVRPAVKVKLSTLRERYEAWCKERGEREVSGRKFGEYLCAHGFESFRSNATWYRGIGVKDVDAVPEMEPAGEVGP